MVMRFKKYLREVIEDADQQLFNDFVEKTLETNRVEKTRAQHFSTMDDFDFSGTCFSVIFMDSAEFLQFDTEQGLDTKGLAGKIASNGDMESYRLFCKSPENVVERIRYKNLYTIDENKTGVIYKVDAPGGIDLTKYNRKNTPAADRLAVTQEVLAVQSVAIAPNDIDSIYFFTRGEGFERITDLGADFKSETGSPDAITTEPEPEVTA